jgi:hypothetical protein
MRFATRRLAPFLALLLLCSGCYEDIGSYSYRDASELNEIIFTDAFADNAGVTYTIKMGDPITLRPTYTESAPNDSPDDYSYAWLMLGYPNSTLITLLSSKKTWEDELIPLPGGRYTIYYVVTDKKTGIEWMSGNFYLYITGQISTGIFMVSDVNDTARVEFVNYFDGEFSPLPNILASLGVLDSLPPLGRPLQVVCQTDYNAPRPGATDEEGRYLLAVVTDAGAFSFAPATFAFHSDYRMENNILGRTPAGFYIQQLFHTTTEGNSLMLGSDGNMYNYSRSQLTYWTMGVPVNVTPNRQRFNVSPHVAIPETGTIPGGGTSGGDANGGYVLYDTDSRSFMRFAGGYSTTSSFYTTPTDSSFKFAFSNTGKDALFMHGRFRVGDIYFVAYAILKDPISGQTELDMFTLDGVQYYSQNITAVPQMADAVQYAMSHNRNNAMLANEFLYYRTDQHIYVYNVSDRSSSEVFAAPAGHRISHFEFIVGGDYIDHLLVCTYDPAAAPQSCGTVQLMAVAPVYGTLSLATNLASGAELRWSGFGKIVDADWKAK